MMVDNSINVLDGCFRAKEKMNYYDAAIEGSRSMIGAITGGTVTNCIVFVPLLLLEGMTGQLFTQLAWTVIFCLTASLFSAVTLAVSYTHLKNPMIRLYVQGKWIECPIVSCRIVRDSDGEPYRSPQSAEKQEEYFARMREASLYDTGLRPGNGDRLITLSTCHGTGKRLIVQALVWSSDLGYNRQSGSEEASQEEQGAVSYTHLDVYKRQGDVSPVLKILPPGW